MTPRGLRRRAAAAPVRSGAAPRRPSGGGVRAARWALVGGAFGLALALVSQWPARWLSGPLQQATGGRVVLADASGTLWNGSAMVVLTGGAGSRDALVMPSRVAWTLRPALRPAPGLTLTLEQPCCLPRPLGLRLALGWTRQTLALDTPGDGLAQWPADWLVGLGAPWNSLQLRGLVRFSSAALTLHRDGAGWRVEGGGRVDMVDLGSRLSPLDTLGSYQLDLTGAGDAVRFTLATREGAFRLSGTGQHGRGGFSFRGQAAAAPGQEAAVGNLLNFVGGRKGAVSVISIG